MKLYLDIYKLVLLYLNFNSKHKFRLLSKELLKLNITDLYNIDVKYVVRINGDILKNYKYVEKICVASCCNISCIKHLTCLKYLIDRCDLLDDSQISGMTKLEYLVIDCNTKITNLNFLTNLKYLDMSETLITNDGIRNCTNIEIIRIKGSKITNLNRLTKLKKLDSSNCVLDKFGINNCTLLEEIELFDVVRIDFDMSCMRNLTRLNASGKRCELANKDIKNCTNLTSLEIWNNKYITDINHLAKLKYLDAGYDSVLSNEGFICCTNIEILDIFGNRNIDRQKLGHLAKLRR